MQMFVAPIHEALDTKFLDINKGMHSGENLKRLFLLRVLFFSGNTLVTAAFPFMGDFINLLGSFSLVPLTFMFPSMVFIKVIYDKYTTQNEALTNKLTLELVRLALYHIVSLIYYI